MARKSRRGFENLSGPLAPEIIMPLIRASVSEHERIPFLGHWIRFGSFRLQTYLKGLVCVDCGLVGTHFSIDRSASGSIHLNLWAIDTQGDELLMTSDHILPKSRGGSDLAINRQPMCESCNFRKGNTIRSHEHGVAKAA